MDTTSIKLTVCAASLSYSTRHRSRAQLKSLKIYAIGPAQEPAPQCASTHTLYCGESCSSIEEDYVLPVGQVQEANPDLDCATATPRDTRL